MLRVARHCYTTHSNCERFKVLWVPQELLVFLLFCTRLSNDNNNNNKVYYNRKTKSQVTDEKCRLCGDSLENVQHILSGCSALAQTKYLQRHNNAFKTLFFEVLRSLDLITKVESWFSQVTPKPLYENEHATAF